MKVLLNETAKKVLNLNSFVLDGGIEKDRLKWSVKIESEGPRLIVDPRGNLYIRKAKNVGTFQGIVSVSDGLQSAYQSILVKVSCIRFMDFFYRNPIALSSGEEYLSPRSFFEFILPQDIDRECIHLELPSSLPNEIAAAYFLNDGHLYIKAGLFDGKKQFQLPVVARYRFPNPSPTSTPTIADTPTYSPAVTPTTAVQVSPIPISTPIRRRTTMTPILRIGPTVTPTPGTIIELGRGERKFMFRLERIDNVGSDPIDFAAADLNRDGKTDFITADFGRDRATLITSQRRFHSYLKTTLNAGGEGCMNACVYDLDGDGFLDIVLLSGYGSRIRVYWGDKSCNYLDSTDFDLPFDVSLPENQGHSAKLRVMAAGCFFRDGKPQLAVTGEGDLKLYSFSSTRNRMESVPVPLGCEPIQIKAVDLDLNGVDELVVTHTHPCGVSVYDVRSGIPIQLISHNLDNDLAGDIPYGLWIGDLNGDRFKDISVFLFSGMLHIGFGDARLRFDWERSAVSNFVMRDWCGGDFNADGIGEFAITGWDINLEKPALAMVCKSDSGGYDECTINPIARIFPLNQLFSIGAVSLNNDNLPDLVLTDRVQNQLVFFINQTKSTP